MAAEYLKVETERKSERIENEKMADLPNMNLQDAPHKDGLVRVIRNNAEMQEGGDLGNIHVREEV